MTPPHLFVLAALCVVGTASPARASGPALVSRPAPLSIQAPLEVPTQIRAQFRAGQTFVSWREIPTPDRRYRVYRSESVIRSSEDLDGADLLGEVDERSSRNQGRTLVSVEDKNWIIHPGAEPLADDQGLFVYTVEEMAQR